MIGPTLQRDYVIRAGHRLAAVEVYFARKAYPDAVYECQNVIDLCLRALLGAMGLRPRKVAEFGLVVRGDGVRMPPGMGAHLDLFADLAAGVERHRTAAFEGRDGVAASAIYVREDAERAREGAALALGCAERALGLAPSLSPRQVIGPRRVVAARVQSRGRSR